MGNMQGGFLGHSRREDLPEDINDDAIKNSIIKSWTIDNIKMNPCNGVNQSSTIPVEFIKKAGIYMDEYFANKDLKVLEIFAGNCVASEILHGELCNARLITWIATDAILCLPATMINPDFNHSQLDALAAVRKFGESVNALLMVSPPPLNEQYSTPYKKGDHGYGDYYACKEFIETAVGTKYIIFIGELGASDGSPGMYKWLMENPKLQLVIRKMLLNTVDTFGGPCEKELFIFATC